MTGDDARTIGGALYGEAADDSVRSPTQAQQHGLRGLRIGRLAEQVATVLDDGVGGDDQAGLGGDLREDGGGFLSAEALRIIDQVFAWQVRFVDLRHDDVKAQSQPGEQLFAARR